MAKTTVSIQEQADALLERILAAKGDKEPFAIGSFVHQLLWHYRMIAAIWCIEDVKEQRPDLNDDQAWDVLQEVESSQNCDLGINWTTLECAADELFGDVSESSGR